MPKLDYLQEKKLNPADELRHLLGSLEERRLKIKSMTATQALALLRDLDRVYTLFQQLQAGGLDLLPEQGRFEAVQARLKEGAAPWLRALGGPDALHRFKPSPAPLPEQWWWFIDERVAAQKRQRLRQMATVVAVIVVVIGLIALALNTVLAPSPEVVARVEAENTAFRALEAGDVPAALAAVETGLSQAPDNPDLLLFKAVLQETLGQTGEAAQNFARVEALYNDPLTFYLSRSQLELRVNQFEKAERDARAALDIDDSSPQAWLFLGQSLELQGRRFQAVPAYEKAGQLALEQGDNEVVVLARLALGRLGGPLPVD